MSQSRISRKTLSRVLPSHSPKQQVGWVFRAWATREQALPHLLVVCSEECRYATCAIKKLCLAFLLDRPFYSRPLSFPYCSVRLLVFRWMLFLPIQKANHGVLYTRVAFCCSPKCARHYLCHQGRLMDKHTLDEDDDDDTSAHRFVVSRRLFIAQRLNSCSPPPQGSYSTRPTPPQPHCRPPSLSDAIEKLLLDEPFCSLSVQELSRLRLRLTSLGLWHGCDLKDMQLRSLEFEDKPFSGGQVGGTGNVESAWNVLR